MTLVITRATKQAARYTDAGGRERCSACRFFMPQGTCGRIIGPVSPQGWCKYFSQEMRQTLQPGVVPAQGGPSLTLDFISTPGTLDPHITFTRASTATYTDATGTVQTAAINSPRWDYSGGVSRGLLIEEARTNIVFPSVNWAANATASGSVDGVVQNVGASPSGANNAMALIPGSFNSLHQFYGVPTVTASTVYTYSVFVKAAGMNFVQIALENAGFAPQYACFNLQTGVVDRQASNSSAAITAAGNGWYRCAITATSTASSPPVYNIYPSAVGGVNGGFSSTGNAVSGIWVWGIQIEAGGFATSYIATTAATVTRAADSCVIPPASMGFYVAPGGSWAAEFIVLTIGQLVNLDIVGPPGASQPTQLYLQTNNQIAQWDTTAAIQTGNAITIGAVSKAASAWAPNTGVVCVNGGAVASATLTVGYAASASAGLDIMQNVPPTVLTGYIRRVRYWPRVLSATEMQQVTT